MSILNDLRIALFDFRSYPKLLKNSKKRVFAFILLVTGIFWVMTSAVPAAMFFARTGGFSRIVETYVPEFTLKDGTLQVAQPFHYANGVMYVDVNTDPSNVVDPSDQKLRTILSLNDMVFVADSKRAVFRVSPVSGTGTGTARMIEFSAFEGMAIDKNYLRQLAPLMNTMECAMCVLFFFVHLAGFFIHAWLISFAGRVFARISRLSLSSGAIFQLSVYTRAFPLFIEGVFFLLGLIFPEMAALGMLYSIFALSRVFRHMSMSGEYYGRSADDVWNRGRGSRDPREGYRYSDEEFRVPTPKTPDGGQWNDGAGQAAEPRQDQEGRADRIPTPKTPDGGGVIPGYSDPAADAGSPAQNEAADAGSQAQNEAADAGSQGRNNAADAGSQGQNNAADAGSQGQNDAADAAARKKTEELKASAEAAGKPAWKPDHTEVREALVKENLKPTDGWSFGSAAEEAPAEGTAPAEAASSPGTAPAGAASSPKTAPAETASSPETADGEQDG